MKERVRGATLSTEELEYVMAATPPAFHEWRAAGSPASTRQRLAYTTGIRSRALVDELLRAGYSAEIGPLLYLAPLVQVAWAEGHVSEGERVVVRKAAWWMCLGEESIAQAELERWLARAPSPELLDRSVDVLGRAFGMLSGEERAGRVEGLLAWCLRVAEASGSVTPCAGDDPITAQERSTLLRIAAAAAGERASGGQGLAGRAGVA